MSTEMFTGMGAALIAVLLGYVCHVLATRQASMQDRLSACESGLDAMRRELQRVGDLRDPTALTARLADVEAALDGHRTAMRKELGKLWGHRGAERAVGNGSADVDDDFQALLELQK